MTICNEFQKTTVSSEPQLGNFISVADAQPNSITADETDKTSAQDTLFQLERDKIIQESPRELEYCEVKNVAQSVAPWYQSHHC
ncbi:unnamed protein product [Sphagnum jensenii]|uniref:Uncharacterized protein n=1 Tax=Sphagnum jensenii TaxID=128206 RepID=A0ABP1B337_9BRYO